MDFTNEKYEYLLQTWGGFYNEQYAKIHNLKPGYFWFDSKEELQKFLHGLQKIEKEMSAFHLATNIVEGQHVRYKTIAKMIMKYKGKDYNYEYDFGFGYPIESAHYMFEDGNYACDCNRSSFLSRIYPEIEEKDCGDEIEMLDFTVRMENYLLKPT